MAREYDPLNAQLMADHHRTLVLRLLKQHGPMSRAEIAKSLGLAPSVITRLVRELLADGCAVEDVQGKSKIGRRPILISFNQDYATAIGVHIQRNKVECALVNMGGKILSRWEMSVSPPPQLERVLSTLAQAIGALRQSNTIGVGVAVSGLVDVRTGHNVFSPVLEWQDVRVREVLESACGLPVYVENDANVLAIAEMLYGAGRRYSDFVCLMVGEGLGSGIMIGKKLHRGAFGGAGEIGHTAVSVDESAPLCRCGERGCLEEFCSNRALSRQAKALGSTDWRELASAARAGDHQAKRVFEEFGRLLGLGIKNAVNIINPQAVIIGGELMEAKDLFFAVTAETVCKHSFPQGRMVIEVLPWEVGEAGFLLGAAGLVEEEFLESPIFRRGKREKEADADDVTGVVGWMPGFGVGRRGCGTGNHGSDRVAGNRSHCLGRLLRGME